MRRRGNMTRRGFLGGLFGGSYLAAQTILLLRSSARYDHYIDDELGDDGNDGLTPATPWQSLNKINTITLSAGETTKVLIKAGSYDKATDYIDVNNGAAGATLDITFEPGCVMDGTAVTAGTPQKGINSYGTAAAWTTVVQGNGLIVRNYDSTPGSTEGIGTRNNNMTLLYDVHVAGCFQGISSHDSSVIKMYGGRLTNQVQQAVAPVGFSRMELYDVAVDQSGVTQPLADLGADTTSLFEDCIFIPHSTGVNKLEVGGATFRRCRIGTGSARVTVASDAANGSLEDCYVNAYIDGSYTVDMLRCYGLLTTRLRNGGSIAARHCVFVGGASGSNDSALFRNFDPGSQGTWEFIDCVLTGYTIALGEGFGATDAGYFAVAGNFAKFINYFGNTTDVDPDLLSAAGTAVTEGVITTDPEIGSADSYNQADYAIGPMSPCIGAGSDGGDIGFRMAA